MAKPYAEAAMLATRLQRARTVKRLSYNALSRLSGVDPAQGFRICRGDFRTLSHNVMRICNALEVELPAGNEKSAVINDSDPTRDRLIAELMATWDQTAAGAKNIKQLLAVVRQIQEEANPAK